MNSGTFASEALPLTSSLGMMISPSMVMVAISSGVKKFFSARTFFSNSFSSGIRLITVQAASFASAAVVSGLFSPDLHASASTPVAIPPTIRVFIDFRLSIAVNLNSMFFHFINNMFGSPHGEGQDCPGDILIRLRNKGAAIHAEQVFAIMRLAPFVQG